MDWLYLQKGRFNYSHSVHHIGITFCGSRRIMLRVSSPSVILLSMDLISNIFFMVGSPN